jgi:hypothetical protein
MTGDNKTLWLLEVNLLFKVAIQEKGLYVELYHFQVQCGDG